MSSLVCTGFWLGNLRERDHWGDPDIDGKIILRWIFRKWEGNVDCLTRSKRFTNLLPQTDAYTSHMRSSHKTVLIHVLFKFSVCSDVNELANLLYTVPCQTLSSKLTHCLTDIPTNYLITVTRLDDAGFKSWWKKNIFPFSKPSTTALPHVQWTLQILSSG